MFEYLVVTLLMLAVFGLTIAMFPLVMEYIQRLGFSFGLAFSLFTLVIIFLFEVLLLISLVYVLINSIRLALRTASQEEHEVMGTVTALEYHDSDTTFTPINAGKVTTFMSHQHSEQYLITVTYQDLTDTFDDKTLYQRVQRGDSVKLILCNSYDKNHELIHQSLSLAEE